MKIAEIGEFGLLAQLTELVQTTNKVDSPNLIKGIGDDAAVWRCEGAIQFTTADCLVENVHFSTRYTGWEELGYKSLTINLSDIAAMGGDPLYAIVSLSIPGDQQLENIKSLYKGMIAAANKYSVKIVGGNISGLDRIAIYVTVQGYSEMPFFLSRSSARPGDKIGITGYTGLSAAGLRMLKNHAIFDRKSQKLFADAHLKPEPRIAEGKTLLRQGVKTAIDISDGLLADLRHICEASKVSAIVQKELVPIHPALKKCFPEDYEQLALTGGEDYELLFTADAGIIGTLKAAMTPRINVIGEIAEGPSSRISVRDVSGKELYFSHAGWDHFK